MPVHIIPPIASTTGTHRLVDVACRESDSDCVGGVLAPLAGLHFRSELRAPLCQVTHSPTFEVGTTAREPIRDSKLPDLRLRRPRTACHRQPRAAYRSSKPPS